MSGMASPGGLAEQHRDMIAMRVRGAAWRGFVFDSGACMCLNIKCPGRGSRCGGGEPVRASSEAETRSRGVWPSSEVEPCSRGRPALERGEASPKGASSPRARWNLTRGGVQPSNEAEPHPMGHPALERGRVSLLRCCAPRAKRSFARGWLGLTVLVGC
jgi:hypothetical protein